MSDHPTVGLALISKNEERNLPTLLASIEGAFDRVALLDTGSDDNTVSVFQEWAKRQGGMTFSIGTYEWKDNFGDARRCADNLLLWGVPEPTPEQASDEPLVQWVSWADCDDTIVNPEQLRELALEATPQISGFVMWYDYAQDPNTGHSICMLKRERLLRARAGRWHGRVHEAQDILFGGLAMIPQERVHWKHGKLVNANTLEEANEAAFGSNERNLRILTKWHEDEPTNTRVLAYLGTETASRAEHEKAIEWYDKYLALESGWTEEKAQVLRRKGASLIALNRPDDAIASAFEALAVLPNWPDSHLTLAQAYMVKAEFDKCLEWARQCLNIGTPDTLLIINPLDYTFLPRKMMAGALGEMERYDDAVRIGREAMEIFPGDIALNQGLRHWQGILKRERTAETFSMCAQQLIAHDEQIKALKLLEECVPHFAVRHPGVCQLRAQLRERLLWVNDAELYADHYENGGSKPEDFLDNDKALEVCAKLPRANFLLDGILDQMGLNGASVSEQSAEVSDDASGD